VHSRGRLSRPDLVFGLLPMVVSGRWWWSDLLVAGQGLALWRAAEARDIRWSWASPWSGRPPIVGSLVADLSTVGRSAGAEGGKRRSPPADRRRYGGGAHRRLLWPAIVHPPPPTW
jgi:hypothetical protein